MRIEEPVWKSCGQIKKIVRFLKGKVRFVGGCVRDGLIGKIPSDIDMATPLKPFVVMEILKKHGFTVLPTGFLYGTVTVLTQSELFPTVEITTLRRDICNDGRRPKVVYTENWQEDALRRDFTFNALYADFDGNVYDYCDGIADLKAGRVRFIGDPALRIAEDYLRVLRYFRFLALFENSPADPETLRACRDAASFLSKLSLNRRRRELFKLISSPNAAYGLENMQRAGLLDRYFPKADIKALERFLKLSPRSDFLNRLSVLSGVTVEGVDESVARWQMSKSERKQMLHIVSFDRNKDPLDFTANDLFRFAVYFKDDDKDLILSLFAAVSDNANWLKIKEKTENILIPPFRFSGSDLIDRVDRKEIKSALMQVYEYWLSTNGQADRSELTAYAEKAFTKQIPEKSNRRNG